MGGGEKKDGMSCMKGMDMGNMSMAQKSSDDAMMAGMDHSKMDMSTADASGGEAAVSSSNPEVDFAKSMIPHHESAIAKAKDLLKSTKDTELKKLAEDIIAAQNKEIKFLYGWLAKNAE